MPDLKYGLPELMINIEMAIFAVLHLWAFSWKPYVIPSQGGEVTDFYGNGKVTYEGGPFGLKALGDAMSPVDLAKAVGRSARWLVVGRRHRMQDPSYQVHRDHETIGLQPPETGIIDNNTAYRGAGGTKSTGQNARYGGDEEGAVLLAHAQSYPNSGPLGASPDEADSDGYLQEPPSRFYQQNAAFDESDYYNTARPSYDVADYPYPPNGPLREQAPMPIPDPYRPPPPYPESRHS